MSVIKKAMDRMRPGENIGLDHVAQQGRQRTINPDGSYNMERITGRTFGNFYLYNWLISAPWSHYWIAAIIYYVIMNILFATIYYGLGSGSLEGIPAGTHWDNFLYCFFFSTQSFTTVGFGGIHPVGKWASGIAGVEAFTGLMTLALATGTLYWRFSKPVSRIRYSKQVIIAPFKNLTGMQLMIANETSATLMEVEAKVNISWVEDEGDGKRIRRYQQANLEFDKIAMFPTNWVINHPIDEGSVLFGKSLNDIKKMDVEVFVLLKGFDDTFSQTIYSRQSYTADQFVFGAKFKRPFDINKRGRMVMDLTKVGEHDLMELTVNSYN